MDGLQIHSHWTLEMEWLKGFGLNRIEVGVHAYIKKDGKDFLGEPQIYRIDVFLTHGL